MLRPYGTKHGTLQLTPIKEEFSMLRIKRFRLIILICATALESPLCGCHAPPPRVQPTDTMPANLRPPTGSVVLLTVHARGEQIYTRAQPGDPFTLRAPEAVLLNARNDAVGRHYAGPTWEAL